MRLLADYIETTLKELRRYQGKLPARGPQARKRAVGGSLRSPSYTAGERHRTSQRSASGPTPSAL